MLLYYKRNDLFGDWRKSTSASKEIQNLFESNLNILEITVSYSNRTSVTWKRPIKCEACNRDCAHTNDI